MGCNLLGHQACRPPESDAFETSERQNLRTPSGGEIQHAAPGDTVWFAPGEKHWHGSAAGHPMVHIAVQEADDSGEVVTWLEPVSE